ncbi:uncharacterized protein HD556DRAFT_383007 [Suillus plorans]|uniref:Uncharacterized protein n=1 Tax=Suillus plorans TaxID=116603 RepID=A0A9P7AS13_9AGAM|nr:uncharacterized protein HD556DRAFT_383007 [Suillus plorans]KAG1795354.1 hypothetical protein HD556DRAFT_383007 [Suillus plorans]
MTDSEPKSIGGEHVAMRANIDIQKLNTYLKFHVLVVATLVQVQQFKREYRILSALHRYNISPTTRPEQIVTVPQPFVLCEDDDVIGTPFYIMEYQGEYLWTPGYQWNCHSRIEENAGSESQLSAH